VEPVALLRANNSDAEKPGELAPSQNGNAQREAGLD
jgi:hypothetical protein